MMLTVQRSFLLVVICIICVGRGLAQKNVFTCFGGELLTPVKAIAYLNSTSVKGTVTFTQPSCLMPTTVQVSLTGLTPGSHGFHVHEKGDLSNGCASTLAHYNPNTRTHGGLNDRIRHEGDMGNIQANSDGVSSDTIVDNYIKLSGSRSIVGRALVVHEKMDDLGRGGNADSLTTGNSGSRIACTVIGYL